MTHILSFNDYINSNIVQENLKNSRMYKTFENFVYVQKSKKSRKSYFSKVGRIYENFSVAKSKMVQDELEFIKENYSSWIYGQFKINVIAINDNEKFLFSKDGTHLVMSNETYNTLNENDKNIFQQFGDFIASFVYGAKDTLTWIAVALEFFAMVTQFVPTLKALGAFALFGAGGIHIFEFFKLVTGSTPNMKLEGDSNKKADKTAPVKKLSVMLEEPEWKSLGISKQTETVLQAFKDDMVNIKKKNDRFNSETYFGLLQKTLTDCRKKALSKKFDSNKLQSLYVSIIGKYRDNLEDSIQMFTKKGSDEKSATETAYNTFISGLIEPIKDVKKSFGLLGESEIFEGLAPDKAEVGSVEEYFNESIGTLSFAMGALISGTLSIAEGIKHFQPISFTIPLTGTIKKVCSLVAEPAIKTFKAIQDSKAIGWLAKIEGHGKIATFAELKGTKITKFIGGMFIKGSGKVMPELTEKSFEALFTTLIKFFMKLSIYGIGSFIGFKILEMFKNIKNLVEVIITFVTNPTVAVNMFVNAIKKEISKLMESNNNNYNSILNEKQKTDQSTISYILSILGYAIDYGISMITNTYTFIMKYINKINFDMFDSLIPTNEEQLALEKYFPNVSKVSGDDTLVDEYKRKAKKSNYLQDIKSKNIGKPKSGKELVGLLKDSLSFENYMNSKESMITERTWFDMFKKPTHQKFANQPTQELKDKALIEKWLHDNDIHKFTINGDLTVDVYQDVPLGYSNLYIIPVKFGKVMGSFTVGLNNLKSLKNCPKYVKGTFSCNGNQLESLLYSPEFVGGSYHCHDNKLRSLDGITKNIQGEMGITCGGNINQFDIYDAMQYSTYIKKFVDKCLRDSSIHYHHFECYIKKR